MPPKQRHQEIEGIEESPPTRQQPYQKTRDGRRYQEIPEIPSTCEHPYQKAHEEQPDPAPQEISLPAVKRIRFGEDLKTPFVPDGSLNKEDREDLLTTSSLEIRLYNRVYDYYNKPNMSQILPRIERTWRFGATFSRNLSMLICCSIFRNQSHFFLKNSTKLATYFRKIRYEIETLGPERSAKKYLDKLSDIEHLSEHEENYAGFLKEIEDAINKKQLSLNPFYAKTAREDENVTAGDFSAMMTAWDTFIGKNPDLELLAVAECSKSAGRVWTSRTAEDAYQAKQEYLLSHYAEEDDAAEEGDQASQNMEIND